jgi:hypothetical protein
MNGRNRQAPFWNLAEVKVKGLEGEKVVCELAVPSKAGKFGDDGHKCHFDLGISVQGQSAADAWKEVDRLAKKWRIPVSIEFLWRQTAKAQHRGKN